MIMVPETVYNGLLAQQQQQLPSVAQMVKLDQQMQNTLSDPMLNADKKMGDYTNVHRRYMKLQGDVLSQLTPMEKEEPTLPENEILTSVPKREKNKVQLLLNHMKKNPAKFQVSKKNELLDERGEAISGSNMLDLVHEVVRNRGARGLAGINRFAEALKDTNVPREALGTTDRLTVLTQPMPQLLFTPNPRTAATPTTLLGAQGPATVASSSSSPSPRTSRKLQRNSGVGYKRNLLTPSIRRNNRDIYGKI